MGSDKPDAPTTLVLWDVDHTLIETGGVGREVFRDAFERVTGHAMERMAEVTGRTEPDIFHETAELHGLDVSTELFEKFATELAAGYVARADEMRRRGRALPGALAALDALGVTKGIFQSVLTGNIRAAAEIKLAVFGLADRIDFEIGAYGSDDAIRSRLVSIAQERASARHGLPFTSHSTVLIGDTPNDIATGHDGGARVIAVASGKSSSEELRQAGADHVLQNLRDMRGLLKGLGRR